MSTVIVAGYPALMAVLFGICAFAGPGWVTVAWAGIGLVSAGAVIFGAWRHAPLRRVPWWLLAAAIFAMATGDAIYGLGADRYQGPLPVIADVCYFAMFPLLMASLVMLTRASVVFSDRSRVLGLMMFICAAALLAWVFLIGPSLSSSRLSSVDRSELAAYVLGDLLVLIMSVCLAFAARRSWTVILLATGSGGLLTANVVYALAQLGDGWEPRQPAVLGYLVLYVTWGAAALHPSMVQLTAPIDTPPVPLTGRWTWRLRLCLAVPSSMMLIESVTARIRDGVVIAVALVVMCELVITQLADMVGKYRRAVARERGLREACGNLVAAVDADEVGQAVRAAVGRLVPAGAGHAVVLSLRDTHDVDSSPGRGVDPALPDLDLMPLPASDRGTRLLRTRLLHPALRDRLGCFDATLVCPLVLDRCFPRGLATGTLFVAGPDQVLDAMRDAVEVLAAQATLALERIALSEAVNRRDGDRYLRTVVQNTADVVLVIDDDDRIRYASPSLTGVLGVDPTAYSTLRDIVHPDDHGQVARTRELAERSRSPLGVQDCWNLRRPDGSRVFVEISYRDLRRDRMVRGFVVTMRDITERQIHEQDVIRRRLEHSGGWQNRQNSLSRFR